jgi:hypothetical protein
MRGENIKEESFRSFGKPTGMYGDRNTINQSLKEISKYSSM